MVECSQCKNKIKNDEFVYELQFGYQYQPKRASDWSPRKTMGFIMNLCEDCFRKHEQKINEMQSEKLEKKSDEPQYIKNFNKEMEDLFNQFLKSYNILLKIPNEPVRKREDLKQSLRFCVQENKIQMLYIIKMLMGLIAEQSDIVTEGHKEHMKEKLNSYIANIRTMTNEEFLEVIEALQNKPVKQEQTKQMKTKKLVIS